MFLTLGAMAGGAALAGYGKMQENDMNDKLLRMKKQQLEDQRRFLDKNQALTTAGERAQMSAASTVASVNSKNAAIQAFQQGSAAEAGTGVSGTAGGTSFFNTAKTIADARTAVMEANSVSSDNMEGMQIGFQQNDLQFDRQRNDLDWQGKYLDLQMDQNEYANSPLSWGLTLGAGALNGLAIGNNLMAAANSMGLFQPKTPVAAPTQASATQAASLSFDTTGTLPSLTPDFTKISDIFKAGPTWGSNEYAPAPLGVPAIQGMGGWDGGFGGAQGNPFSLLMKPQNPNQWNVYSRSY